MSEIPTSAVFPEEKGKVLTAELFRHVAAAMDDGEVKPIFRRFGVLNTVNLLILQTELTKLEEQFFALSLSQDDAKKGDMASFYLGMRQRGYSNHQSVDKLVKEKGDLFIKLQQTLKTYSGWGSTEVVASYMANAQIDNALLEAAQLRSLEPPDNGDIEYLRLWLNPEMGGQGLEEADKASWSVNNSSDLVTLEAQLRRENQVFLRIKMAFYILIWKFRKYKKVSKSF